MRILSSLAVLIFVALGSVANAATEDASHDLHRSGESIVVVTITKIVSYENGMSLILAKPTQNNETCLHLENAASFTSAKLNRVIAAAGKETKITLKTADGHVLDVL